MMNSFVNILEHDKSLDKLTDCLNDVDSNNNSLGVCVELNNLMDVSGVDQIEIGSTREYSITITINK